MVVQIVLRLFTVVFYFLSWWLFPAGCVAEEENNGMKLQELVNEEDSKKDISENNNDFTDNSSASISINAEEM